MKRAVAPIIATLLLLAIAVIGSTLVFLLLQHFLGGVQAGGSLTSDVAQMIREKPEIP